MSNKSYIQRICNTQQILTAMYIRKPFTPLANSTLNLKFGVNPDEVPADGEYPRLGFWCIGRGAHQLVSKDSGGSSPMDTPIYATDNSVELATPFVARELTDDLTSIERLRYGVREVREINGKVYALYWLRRLDMDNVSQVTELQTTENGEVIASKPYTPAPESLSPAARNYSDTALTTSRQRVITYAKIEVNFTEDDVKELMDACTILYNDPTAATVTEIGIVSGIDRERPIQTAGGQDMMREVICAQLNAHIHTYQALHLASKGFDLSIMTGAGEPITVPETV